MFALSTSVVSLKSKRHAAGQLAAFFCLSSVAFFSDWLTAWFVASVAFNLLAGYLIFAGLKCDCFALLKFFHLFVAC